MADGGYQRSAGGVLMPAPKVVWSPLAGSQELAMSCPCNHILVEGTRGPGKTDGQLFKFRRHVGLGYGKFWRGVIFDREYKNLDDLISKSRRWFPEFDDGAKFLSGNSQLKWVWPTGEELLFRVAKKLADYWNYHGQEFPFIGWNELTKYPGSELYDIMMSCNRSSFRPEDYPVWVPGQTQPQFLPEMPLVVYSTTNPFGAGHNWVKKRFIDPAPPGQVVRYVTNVFNPRTKQREDIVKTQVRIFCSYKENKYLSPEYVAELENIRDPNRRRAWLFGDWDITAGGAIDDLWDEMTHLAPRFKVPSGWKVDRSFDWGSTKPFSVGWWAEANGEEATLADGSKWCPPPGTLIRIYDLYGSKELGTNKGVLWGPKKVAREVKAIDEMLLKEGWIAEPVRPGPADGAIYDVRPTDDEDMPESIAAAMEDEDVYWQRADKSPGSRKNGLQLLRDRLQASLDFEGAGIYFMRNCAATMELLPGIQRDEEDQDDVDTETEDHLYDEVRYRVLKGNNRKAEDIEIEMPH
jgi:hypothetical protein